MRVIIIVVLNIVLLNIVSSQNNYSGDTLLIDGNAVVTFNVISDFGPRLDPGYDWHGGVDYTLENVHDGETILCATMNEGKSTWEVKTFNSRF